MDAKIQEILRKAESNHYVMSKHLNEQELYNEIRDDFFNLVQYIILLKVAGIENIGG